MCDVRTKGLPSAMLRPVDNEEGPIVSDNPGIHATPKAADKKRHRVNLTQAQKVELERLFVHCKYPDYRDLEALGRTIGVPYRKMLIWFKNRRAKDKRTRKVVYGPEDFAPGFNAAAAAAAAAAASVSYSSAFSNLPQQQQQQYPQIYELHHQYHEYYMPQHMQQHPHNNFYEDGTFEPPSTPAAHFLRHPWQHPYEQPQPRHSQLALSPPTPEFPPSAGGQAPDTPSCPGGASSACHSSHPWLCASQDVHHNQDSYRAAQHYQQEHQLPPRVRYITEFIASSNTSTPMVQSRML